MIIREKYLSKIRPFYDQDLIKVIMGVRRCGKSVILLQIIDELKEKGIPDSQIIYINFEYEDYAFIKNDKDLHNYIKEKIVNENKYYLFFDEIQNVEHWEKAINSFKASKNVSIFITGSNSDLLSGELATHIAGRYVSFNVYPFTFKEVCEFKNITEELAFIEGEGDKSLEYYRNEHYKIFKKIDSNFNDESKVVFEMFKVIEKYN